MAKARLLTHSPHQILSLAIPFAAPRYSLVGRLSTDPTQAAPGYSNGGVQNCVGITERKVDATGLTITDLTLLDSEAASGLSPSRDDIPVKVGYEVGILPLPDRIEYEGGDYLMLSGTGALSASTPFGTECEAFNGRLRVTQGSGTGLYTVEDAALTPEDAGAVRIRFQRIML
jgi:hypothetical protein